MAKTIAWDARLDSEFVKTFPRKVWPEKSSVTKLDIADAVPREDISFSRAR